MERLSEHLFKEKWEIKTLDEIALKIFSGNGVTDEQKSEGGDFPAVKTGDLSAIKKIYFHETQTFINPDLIKNKKTFKKGDIVVIGSSGSVKVIGKSLLYKGERECIAGTGIYVVKHSQNPEYLIHAFNSKGIKKQIKKAVMRNHIEGMQGRLSLTDFKKIKIPIPPLEIQQEIVEFLDKFIELEQELERELERELEERKKQYEYFKNLVFNRGIEKLNWEMRTIEQIATDIYFGGKINKKQLEEGNFPAIRFTEIFNCQIAIKECKSFVNPDLVMRKKYVEAGDILMATTSNIEENIGKACVYLGKEKCLVGENLVIIKSNQNPIFLSYAISSKFSKKQIKKLSQKSTVYYLTQNRLKQIQIPLPSLEIQEEIVEKLDKFYRIVNDLEEGIPALIMDNRRQYEGFKEKIFEI